MHRNPWIVVPLLIYLTACTPAGPTQSDAKQKESKLDAAWDYGD